MRSVGLDFTFLHRKGLDELTGLLESNPRFVFTIHRRKRGKNDTSSRGATVVT
jgi:hypothetical protein